MSECLLRVEKLPLENGQSSTVVLRPTTVRLSWPASALRTDPKSIGPFSQGVDFPPAHSPTNGANLHVEQCPNDAEKHELKGTAPATADADRNKHQQDTVNPQAHLLE